jgi:hypothetical protein
MGISQADPSGMSKPFSHPSPRHQISPGDLQRLIATIGWESYPAIANVEAVGSCKSDFSDCF